jgi:endoglycosylceramidase
MQRLPFTRAVWILPLAYLTLATIVSPGYGQDRGAGPDRICETANTFISVKDGAFVDAAGRQVVLHGINVGEKSKARNYLSWHGPEQFAAMREWGFNCIRLLIIWDGLEPEPGRYDDNYLSGVDKRIAWAKQNGIYVLLDMHQDLYSAKFGADGAPLWATLDDGKPHVSKGGVWSNAYFTSKAVQTAFDNFWANKAGPDGVGIQDRFALAWQHVAKRYADEPAVLGYDILNEPFIGSQAVEARRLMTARFAQLIASAKGGAVATDAPQQNPDWTDPDGRVVITRLLGDMDIYVPAMEACEPISHEFERTKLAAMYERVGKAIRQVDKNHIIFIQTGPFSIAGARSGIGPLLTPAGEPDPLQAFAPHGYDIVTDTAEVASADSRRVELIFARHGETAQRLGLPMIVGEWGAYGRSREALPAAADVVRQFEKLLCGDTYWQFNKGVENTAYFPMLKRPYPQAVAGTLISYRFDPETGLLECVWKENPSTTGSSRIYLPDSWFREGYEVDISPTGQGYQTERVVGTSHSVHLSVEPTGQAVERKLVVRPTSSRTGKETQETDR